MRSEFPHRAKDPYAKEELMWTRTVTVTIATTLLTGVLATHTQAELAGASHSAYESRPKEVAAVIEEAAQHAPR